MVFPTESNLIHAMKGVFIDAQVHVHRFRRLWCRGTFAVYLLCTSRLTLLTMKVALDAIVLGQKYDLTDFVRAAERIVKESIQACLVSM